MNWREKLRCETDDLKQAEQRIKLAVEEWRVSSGFVTGLASMHDRNFKRVIECK